MNFIKYLLLSFVLIVLSCKKKPPTTQDLEETGGFSNGVLILNEGLFNYNNSELSWLDFAKQSTYQNVFKIQTGRGLGDTANDLAKYGGKIYVVVNVSNTIEVVSIATGKSLKQISMMNGAIGKQPRSIVFYKNKAYVSCFDGYIDVIDTTSLEVEQRISVGLNPEDLVVSNQKLYVSNSGGLNLPLMDSTVSVIDLQTNTEISRITVGKNPGELVSVGNDFVFVITRGNYGSIPSRMHKISSVNDVKTTSYGFQLSSFTSNNTSIFYTYNSKIGKFDVSSGMIENVNFILPEATTLYKIQYLPELYQIIVFDANNYTNLGWAKFYSDNGTFIREVPCNLNPSKAIVL